MYNISPRQKCNSFVFYVSLSVFISLVCVFFLVVFDDDDTTVWIEWIENRIDV